jgi:hypothetical protein
MGKYSGAKGRFVQEKMKQGVSKDKARQMWKKSEERKEFPSHFEYEMNKAGRDNRTVTDNIDRSYDSPMQDWAETSDDL